MLTIITVFRKLLRLFKTHPGEWGVLSDYIIIGLFEKVSLLYKEDELEKTTVKNRRWFELKTSLYQRVFCCLKQIDINVIRREVETVALEEEEKEFLITDDFNFKSVKRTRFTLESLRIFLNRDRMFYFEMKVKNLNQKSSNKGDLETSISTNRYKEDLLSSVNIIVNKTSSFKALRECLWLIDSSLDSLVFIQQVQQKWERVIVMAARMQKIRSIFNPDVQFDLRLDQFDLDLPRINKAMHEVLLIEALKVSTRSNLVLLPILKIKYLSHINESTASAIKEKLNLYLTHIEGVIKNANRGRQLILRKLRMMILRKIEWISSLSKMNIKVNQMITSELSKTENEILLLKEEDTIVQLKLESPKLRHVKLKQGRVRGRIQNARAKGELAITSDREEYDREIRNLNNLINNQNLTKEESDILQYMKSEVEKRKSFETKSLSTLEHPSKSRSKSDIRSDPQTQLSFSQLDNKPLGFPITESELEIQKKRQTENQGRRPRLSKLEEALSENRFQIIRTMFLKIENTKVPMGFQKISYFMGNSSEIYDRSVSQIMLNTEDLKEIKRLEAMPQIEIKGLLGSKSVKILVKKSREQKKRSLRQAIKDIEKTKSRLKEGSRSWKQNLKGITKGRDEKNEDELRNIAKQEGQVQSQLDLSMVKLDEELVKQAVFNESNQRFVARREPALFLKSTWKIQPKESKIVLSKILEHEPRTEKSVNSRRKY